MDDLLNLHPPAALSAIEEATNAIGFTLASDLLTGSLLRTLAAAKPGGAFLEIGTGTGMGTAWILDGLDAQSRLMTIDNDEQVVAVARRYLGQDPRVTFHVTEGVALLQTMQDQGSTFDFIFADTWPGKFSHLNVALQLLKPGGLYIVDDMLPQPFWPEDHAPKVASLISTLEQRADLRLTKLNWSTGLIVAAKVRSP
jgi:predicted O-methyltransferase YrrM